MGSSATPTVLIVLDETADVAVHTAEETTKVELSDFQYVNNSGSTIDSAVIADLEIAAALEPGLRTVAFETIARWIRRRSAHYHRHLDAGDAARDDETITAAVRAWSAGVPGSLVDEFAAAAMSV